MRVDGEHEFKLPQSLRLQKLHSTDLHLKVLLGELSIWSFLIKISFGMDLDKIVAIQQVKNTFFPNFLMFPSTTIVLFKILGLFIPWDNFIRAFCNSLKLI